MGYLRMSYFLHLKPFHMRLFGPVPPDGEVSPDSRETETEKRLQSKTEDRPGRAGGQGAVLVASGFRGTSLALVAVSVWPTPVPGAGGQWMTPDSTVAPYLLSLSPSRVWGLLIPRSVSGFKGIAGSVGMHIEDVIASNKSLEGNDPSAGNSGWETVFGWA